MAGRPTCLEVFGTYFGPTVNALATLEPADQERLLDDHREVFERYNRASDGTAVVENQYLQTIVVSE